MVAATCEDIKCEFFYVEINHPNALKLYISLVFSQWLLHVSAKQCHPQEATIDTEVAQTGK
jgi:hypothetical protein